MFGTVTRLTIRVNVYFRAQIAIVSGLEAPYIYRTAKTLI